MFTARQLPQQVPGVWVVERLDVDGEELPVIRHTRTWLPAPIALRHAFRTRYRLGTASLATYLRAAAILYSRAESEEGAGNFKAFLTSGRILTRDQLERAVTLFKLHLLERLDAGRNSIKPQTAEKDLSVMVAFARHLAAHPAWMPAGRSFDWSDMC